MTRDRRGWRYMAARLNGDGTETFLTRDLPLKDVEIEEALSGVGSITGTLAPEYERLIAPDKTLLLQEWGTVIYAESEGNIRGAGIFVDSSFEGPKWQIECPSFIYYADQMPYTGAGQKFIDTDTLDIARYIWTHIQSQVGGNIGLTFDQRDSGVRVGSELASEEYDPEGGEGGLTLQTQAYKLAYYQDHDLLDNFDGLSKDTPFDYVEKHYWEGGVVRHRIEFGVPRLGRRRNDLRFAIGENILVRPSIERPGDGWASEVYCLGAGEGGSTIRGHAQSPRGGRVRRVGIISDPSIRRLPRANNEALAELKVRSVLDEIGEVTIWNHPHAPIGSVDLGDEIRIRGKLEWVDVDAWYRVVARTIKPDASDSMNLTLVRSDKLAA